MKTTCRSRDGTQKRRVWVGASRSTIVRRRLLWVQKKEKRKRQRKRQMKRQKKRISIDNSTQRRTQRVAEATPTRNSEQQEGDWSVFRFVTHTPTLLTVPLGSYSRCPEEDASEISFPCPALSPSSIHSFP